MNEEEDLSDQSEGESYSYSAPGVEPLSRDPSEPLFDADFQVQCDCSEVQPKCIISTNISFISVFVSFPPPRAPLLQHKNLPLMTQLTSWV